jgi:hypothetical protein
LQGRTGGRSVVYSGQLYFSLGACVAHLCLWLCGDGSRLGVQRSGAEPRVESCWSSSGDVESSMLLLPHTRTHLRTQKQKKKKKNCTYHSNGWRNETVRYIWYQSGYDPRLGIHYGFR